MNNLFVNAVICALLDVRDTLNRTEDSTLFSSFARGEGGDISSGFDLKAEAIFFKHLSPFGSLFSEESGWMTSRSAFNIILDPVDGSDNFASFFPYYGVSIAREYLGKTIEGIVCNLANGDIFIRTECDYYRTTLDNFTHILPITVNLNPKIGLFEKAYEHPRLSERLMANHLKYRSPGALALSLAYAPLVKYVLFLGTMRSFDIQAGLYLSQGLYTESSEKYILISSSKEVFDQIRIIVEKEYF